jgi:micrococcal nuclease
MGTLIQDVPVTKVVDGDTLNVLIDGQPVKLRLTCIDTEESLSSSNKPVTEAGKAASELAKRYFVNADGSFAHIDIEFDTNDPVEVCMFKHLDNYGRLLCYVHKDGENFSLKLIREGWSPYFNKYGRSRVYHEEFAQAEAAAQADNLPIWNPSVPNRGDYVSLIAWWSLRDSIIQDYRHFGLDSGAMSVRLDYVAIRQAAEAGRSATVLCDLQADLQPWTDGSLLVYAGSPQHKFNLWIPDATDESNEALIRLLERRYAGTGRRNYVYVSGLLSLYKGTPQFILSDIHQLSDFPPG